jgi:hypothetical protein
MDKEREDEQGHYGHDESVVKAKPQRSESYAYESCLVNQTVGQTADLQFFSSVVFLSRPW